jgi:cation-transporting P-type ATPase C
LRHSADLAQRIQLDLKEMEGTIWVRANQTCASVAVSYVPDTLSKTDIAARIKSLLPPSPVQQTSAVACATCRQNGSKTGGGNPVRKAGIRFGGLTAVMAGTLFRNYILKAAVGQALFSPLGLIAVAATIPLIKKSLRDLRQKRFGLDGFLAGSIVTAVAMGEALTALEILWIDSGADLLNTWINQRSRRAISDILQVSSKNTFISVDGQEVEVPVEEIRPGDLVVLHTGEKVSVDGVVESGRALLDESPINGRSEFALRTEGDTVLAGTLVREGVIFVRAQKVGDQTYLSRVMHMVEDALENQAPIQGVADQLAARLLKLGGVLTLGTLLVTASFWRAFTVLLVMACPCATVLSASAPISAALNAAARRRILIKGGRYLEEAGEADIVCFDKTGTLTTNQPALRQLANLSDLPDQRLLQLAYTAEMHNFHPLALAIKKEAAEMGLEPTSHVVCQYQLGEGVSARMNGKSIYVGNRRFMKRHVVDLSKANGIADSLEADGLTVAYLALQDELLGVLGFANQTRPEALPLVRHLARDGVKRLVMITGEEGCSAGSLAAELGMHDCHYSVMPETKARIVDDLKAPGRRVLMVGDGINDALALAQADVGIAMGAGGSEVAIEAADIALVTDDLNGVAYLRSLSKTTMRVVQQNFWIATGSNLAGMALGALGMLSPVAAGLLHIFHTLGILANSSRLLSYQPPPLGSAEHTASRDRAAMQLASHAKPLESETKTTLTSSGHPK